jgi:hypothetical protein
MDMFQIDLSSFGSLNAPAEVLDFNATDDRIEVSYDPTDGDPPVIEVAEDPADAANALILADGTIIAVIRGGAGLTADAIGLIADPKAL